MAIYLKEFWECIAKKGLSIEEVKANNKKGKKLILEYGKMLENKGWTYDIIEGGYISANHEIIFYTDRNGHVGQICPYLLKGEIGEDKFVEILKLNNIDINDFLIV